MEHTVFCVKFQRQMPGLDEPPFDNELGQKIYDNVSQEAWRMWMEHCKMLLNEYRLNPSRREDQEVIVKQLEAFFFGEAQPSPKNTCRRKNKKLSGAPLLSLAIFERQGGDFDFPTKILPHPEPSTKNQGQYPGNSSVIYMHQN